MKTIEEIRQTTADMLGVSNDSLDYITVESILADEKLGDDLQVGQDVAAATLYGNNARYGARVINGTTYQVYYFEHGGDYQNANDACGTAYTAWARQDVWHHTYLGKCPNGREKWSFNQ